MAPNTSIPHLVNFLRAALSPDQVRDLVKSLQETTPDVPTLDPESTRQAPKKAPAPIAAPVGLAELLNEMETAFDEKQFPAPSKTESDRINEQYPGLSKRIAAFQGRQFVKMLRERLKL